MSTARRPLPFFCAMKSMNVIPVEAVKRKRGRPAKVPRDLGLEDVARALCFAPEALERLLVRAPGCLPGMTRDDGVWGIAERDLLRFLGDKGALEQRATVRDVAESLQLSVHTVYAWLKMVNPATKKPLLPSHKVLGHLRIFARDVLALPSEWPEWAPARPLSFFAREEEAA